MSPTRREFIQQSGSLILGASAIGALGTQWTFADNPDDAKQPATLVAIYLRGGADPLNTLIPYTDPQYYEVRPTIAIPPMPIEDVPGVLPLNRYFGFHPSMQPLMDIYEAGHLAPILNVGSPHGTRSHFDAQDFMERAAPGIKTITEGWLNRYLAATRTGNDSELRAIAAQPLLPRSLRGEYPVLAVPGYAADQAMSQFEALYQTCEDPKHEHGGGPAPVTQSPNDADHAMPDDDPAAVAHQMIVGTGANTIRRVREYRKLTQRRVPDGVNYPRGMFAQQMRDIASVIKANKGLEVAAVDYRGWDHHAAQGGSIGTFARMMGDVSATLAAFYRDMGPRMNRTLVLLMSEFGRTVRENGNNGTDHGRAGYMLAMGGMVNGKGKVAGSDIYGQWRGLDASVLEDRRDLPVTTDFRQVFDEVLLKLFNFHGSRAKSGRSDFFPGRMMSTRHLGFLREVPRAGA